MFCFRVIILIIISNIALLQYYPYAYNLDDYHATRALISGWPDNGLTDLANDGFPHDIFVGTGGGLGRIDPYLVNNLLLNGLFEVNDSDLPIGGSAAVKTYATNQGNLIITSGAVDNNGVHSGRGISWSVDGGTNWSFIDQPIDVVDYFIGQHQLLAGTPRLG